MIKAVIYDLDNLVVNSESLHAQAIDEVLMQYKVKLKDIPADLRNKFIGRRVIDVIDEVIGMFKLKQDKVKLLSEVESIFLHIAHERLQLMPGVHESISRLKKKGLKLALATSATRKYIDLVMTKFNLQSDFDVVVSGEDVERGKPDPETYTKAAQLIGLSPSECVVLEDASNGVTAAKAAGCYCIAVPSPYTPDQDLIQADSIADSLKELDVGILNKLVEKDGA